MHSHVEHVEHPSLPQSVNSLKVSLRVVMATTVTREKYRLEWFLDSELIPYLSLDHRVDFNMQIVSCFDEAFFTLVSALSSTWMPQTLITLGAKHLVLIQEGQIWRLVTPILLHGGVLHIIMNVIHNPLLFLRY